MATQTQTTHRKYGSFNITMKDLEGNEFEYIVNPLSQKELAQGWNLVVPNKRVYFTTEKNEDGSERRVRKSNESFFKVNLSQLPNSLWDRVKTKNYKESSQRRAVNGCYVYILTETPVDDEIRELREWIHCADNEDYVDRVRVAELCSKLEENDINGWVLIRGRQLK